MDVREAIAKKLQAYEAHLSYLRVEVNRFEGAVTALRALAKELEQTDGSVDAAPDVGRQTEEAHNDDQGAATE